MKSTLILAASALLGSANAGVHRMKLEKIPLENQLVSNFEDVAGDR
jgi:saccharopepsin